MMIKNTILSLFILIVGFNQTKAQEDLLADENLRQTPTGYIALNVGLVTATGNFSDENIGGAISGMAAQLSMSAPFENSFFGLAAKVNYGTYTMTNQPFYAQQIAIMRKFGLDTSATFVSNINQEITRTVFLVGMYGTLPIITDKRLSLDGRILFGPNFMSRPELTMDLTDASNVTKTFTQEASKSSTFAYDLGMSIRYNLLKSNKLCVMLSFDYLTSRANFELESNSKYSDDADQLQEGIHTERIKFTTSSYDITVGIGYVW